MSLDLKTIENRIMDSIHTVLGEVQQAEPAIEQGAEAALLAAGAPPVIAAAAEDLLSELLKHFRGQGQAPTAITVPPGAVTQGAAPVAQTLQVTPASQLSN